MTMLTIPMGRRMRTNIAATVTNMMIYKYNEIYIYVRHANTEICIYTNGWMDGWMYGWMDDNGGMYVCNVCNVM